MLFGAIAWLLSNIIFQLLNAGPDGALVSGAFPSIL
jgi:hypothetical protein